MRPAPALHEDDAGFVARLRAGDETAYERLFLAHHEALWRFAYGFVRSRDVAEEIVQDVFLHLWRDRARWDARAPQRAWLYAAVRNQALNHVRHERVVARLADRTRGPGGDAPDVHEALAARELDDVVARAIAGLSERRRAAMSLRWNHDMSAPEIARVLDTTPEAVRVLLTRARQELAALLADLRR